MARHNSGNKLWTIGKIAPLISFERSLRKLADSGERVLQDALVGAYMTGWAWQGILVPM